MKLRHNSLKAAIAAFAVVSIYSASALASPELAEDRAYTVAAKFRDRGFLVQPTTSGLLGRGQTYLIQIPVTQGLDYLVIGAGDEAATDIDIYIYSEVGTLVIDDRRPLSDALVQFRAQYTGSVNAYIFMAQTDPSLGLPSWAVFVGRRDTVFTGQKPAGQVNPTPKPTEPVK